MAMGPDNNHFTLIDRKPRKIGLRSSASGEEGLEFSDQTLQPGAIGQRAAGSGNPVVGLGLPDQPVRDRVKLFRDGSGVEATIGIAGGGNYRYFHFAGFGGYLDPGWPEARHVNLERFIHLDGDLVHQRIETRILDPAGPRRIKQAFRMISRETKLIARIAE